VNWLFQILTKGFEMKTPETLNTKHVDIFLRFPTNICVSHADKLSNGYAIGIHDEAKFSTKICKCIEFLKTEEDSARERNQDNRLNEWRMLCDHSRLDGMRNPRAMSTRDAVLSWWWMTIDDEGLDSEKRQGLEGLP
jgi:hypothetical protein